MANIRTAPGAPSSLSSSGRSIVNALTQDYAWDASTIQYYLGGPGTVGWDNEFGDIYDYLYTGPADAQHAYVPQTVRAFEMIDSVVALDFQRLVNPTVAQAQADMVIVTSRYDVGLEGFNQFVGDATRSGSDRWTFGTITSDLPYMNEAPVRGGGEYLNWTILHEIGHGLGLLHPHEEESGLPAQYEIGEALDNEAYTVMSYDPATSADDRGHVVSLMPIDIAALQSLYGAEAYATGDSTYTFTTSGTADLDLAEGNVTIGDAIFAIWDTGGTDEIRYSGTNLDAVINLNAASLDRYAAAPDAVRAIDNSEWWDTLVRDDQDRIDDSDYTAGGFRSGTMWNGVSDPSGAGLTDMTGGTMYIAHGVTIENGTGGSGADVLLGNEVDNVLTGNAGDDLLAGGEGDDTLLGGAGDDIAAYNGLSTAFTVTFDGTDYIVVDDRFNAPSGTDRLNGIEELLFQDGLYDIEILAGTAANVITGTRGRDTLLGTAGEDEITGLDGADYISGGAGDDVIRGDGGPIAGPGNADPSNTVMFPSSTTREAQVMDGNYAVVNGVRQMQAVGTGSDALEYFALTLSAPTTVTFELEADGVWPAYSLYGSDGRYLQWESVAGGWTYEFTQAGTYYVSAESDFGIFLPEGVEYTFTVTNPLGVLGTGMSNTNDTIQGGAGADTIYGDDGMDMIVFDTSGQAVTVDLALGTGRGGHAEGDTYFDVENVRGSRFGDTLIGDAGSNRLIGRDGNDTIRSGAGSDQDWGGAGNDVIVGGAGADYVHGGTGRDTLDFSASRTSLTIDLTTIVGTGRGGDAQGDTYRAIESVLGGAAGDTINGSGQANRIEGGAGNDMLRGLGGNDVIQGGAGNDTIVGGLGADTINGGAGTDTVSFGASTTGVTATLSTLVGSGTGGEAEGDSYASVENLAGSRFNDAMTGSGAVNQLAGAAGNDTLRGLGGNDVLIGGAGNDTLDGGSGADRLVGGTGFDIATYGNARAGVTASLTSVGTRGEAAGDSYAAIEGLRGSRFGDGLTGNGAANRLDGGAGSDVLRGEGGADVIDGGAGTDTLFGGSGGDFFAFSAGFGSDTIRDFENGVDRLDFRAHADVATFADLTVSRFGQAAVVSDGGGNQITLLGMAGEVEASDFVF